MAEAGSDDDESRAAALRRLDMDRAAMRLHDAVAERQPDAGSGADLLGGEERLEDARQDLLRDAGAGVADPDDDTAASWRRGRAETVILRWPVPAVQRLLGIDQQVDQNLAELVGIGPDRAAGPARMAIDSSTSDERMA